MVFAKGLDSGSAGGRRARRFQPGPPRFKCFEPAHANCAIHPSSLMEQLSSPKRKFAKDQAKYAVLCWFGRLKTSDLYLFDATLLSDMLPLMLFAPQVSQREGDPSVFEIAVPLLDPDEDEEMGSEAGAGGEEEEEGRQAPPPPLLLRLSDPSLAEEIWGLRRALNELVDRVIGQPPTKLPAQVGCAFDALRPLVHASYRCHAEDPEARRNASFHGAVGFGEPEPSDCNPQPCWHPP